MLTLKGFLVIESLFIMISISSAIVFIMTNEKKIAKRVFIIFLIGMNLALFF